MTEIDQEQLGELLSAYLDGELDDQQLQEVEQLLKEDDSARQLYNELQQTSQLVATLPRQQAPASIIEEFQLQQERDELLGDPITLQIDSGQRRTPFKAILSIAVAITVIVTGGLWMTREHGDSQPGPGGDVLAFAESDESKPEALRSFEFDHDLRNASESRSNSHPTIQSLSGAKTAGAETFQNKDLTAKLESGTNVQAIQTHAFSVETLRLKIKTRSVIDCDNLAVRLLTHLSKHKVHNLANAPVQLSMNSQSPGFFFRGKSGVNYSNKNQSQIIVRVGIEEMNDLLDELSHEKDMDDRISLTAGPLTFRGIHQARSSLQRHESARLSSGTSHDVNNLRRSKSRSSRRKNRTPASRGKSNSQQKKSSIDEGFYDDLSVILGLDRTTVEKMLNESTSENEISADVTDLAMQNDDHQTGVNTPMEVETFATKPNPTPQQNLQNEPPRFITFVVELSIDQPASKRSAKTRSVSPKKTNAKSKSHSKPSAQ